MDQAVHHSPVLAPVPPDTSDTFILPTGMGREQFHAMGTTISLLLPEPQLSEGTDAVYRLFAHWEQTLSRFDAESELSQLNRYAGRPVKVSPLLFSVMETALQAAQATQGLYDPTLLKQMVQMGYDRSFDMLPATAPTSSVSPSIGGGWRDIQLDTMVQRITLPEGQGVDFGGIAKGMAVDAALLRLKQMGIETALVNAGGDLAVMGLPPDEESWSIAIQGQTSSWGIPLRNGALATSGIARRHWQQGTQTRHHLIDPRTGESAQSGLWSVTVAANRCEQAEVAAKVAFLLGPEQGKDFLERHMIAGLLIHEDGSWTSASFWPVSLMKEMDITL